MAEPDNAAPDNKQPLIAHLIELRSRMVRGLIGVGVTFLACVPFTNELYHWLALPLIERLPQGSTMIATEVAAPFFVPVKFTIVLAFFAAVPYLLYQLWAFIAPGLYQNERRLFYPLLVSSALLFYLGMAFAYLVVFPLVFTFLIGTAPEGVAVMTDIGAYLGFVLKMFFAFGVAFEVPVATVLLVWAGITTPKELAEKRPYIIVGAFVVGMLLTPPDAFSQTLLAVPMWLLFEVGLVVSRFYTPRRATARGEAPGGDNG